MPLRSNYTNAANPCYSICALRRFGVIHMTLKNWTAAVIFLLLGASPLIADCGYDDFVSDYSRVKVITTSASSGTVELLTIPRNSREPWPYESYDVTVTVYDAETCSPHPAARVWYKDNVGMNHDLAANVFNSIEGAAWMDRLGRPQFGVFRLRAAKNATRALIFQVHYRPASPLPPLSTPQIQSERPGPVRTEQADNSAGMLDVTLRNQASFSVTFEITDMVCGSSIEIEFAPWEERTLPICSDSGYGKIIYRDVRNQSGIEATLLSEGDRINM